MLTLSDFLLYGSLSATKLLDRTRQSLALLVILDSLIPTVVIEGGDRVIDLAEANQMDFGEGVKDKRED